MHSPVLMTLILLTYVFLSVYAGPRFMANRKPLTLKGPMVVYNFTMVVMNGYIVHQVNDFKCANIIIINNNSFTF